MMGTEASPIGQDERVPLAWWLVPQADAAQRLSRTIEALAQQVGGPVFEPHVTVAMSQLPLAIRRDGINRPALQRTLQARLAPIHLRPLGLGHGPRYFQSIFLRLGEEGASGEGEAGPGATEQDASEERGAGQGAVEQYVSGERGAGQGVTEQDAAAEGGAGEDALEERGAGQGVMERYAEEEGAAEAGGESPGPLAHMVATLAEVLDAHWPSETQPPAFEPHLSLFYGELEPAKREALVARIEPVVESIFFDSLVAVAPRSGVSSLAKVADWEVILRLSLAKSS